MSEETKNEEATNDTAESVNKYAEMPDGSRLERFATERVVTLACKSKAKDGSTLVYMASVSKGAKLAWVTLNDRMIVRLTDGSNEFLETMAHEAIKEHIKQRLGKRWRNYAKRARRRAEKIAALEAQLAELKGVAE